MSAHPEVIDIRLPAWRPMCEEHQERLNPDGTCPKCREASGNPFVLDMQSIYLEPATQLDLEIDRICEEFIADRCKEFER